MPSTSRFVAAAATATALMGGAAQAETRSSQAIPAKAVTQAATPQGPKNGFPDNPGLDNAREVANENARFLRNDSEG